MVWQPVPPQSQHHAWQPAATKSSLLLLLLSPCTGSFLCPRRRRDEEQTRQSLCRRRCLTKRTGRRQERAGTRTYVLQSHSHTHINHTCYSHIATPTLITHVTGSHTHINPYTCYSHTAIYLHMLQPHPCTLTSVTVTPPHPHPHLNHTCTSILAHRHTHTVDHTCTSIFHISKYTVRMGVGGPQAGVRLAQARPTCAAVRISQARPPVRQYSSPSAMVKASSRTASAPASWRW